MFLSVRCLVLGFLRVYRYIHNCVVVSRWFQGIPKVQGLVDDFCHVLRILIPGYEILQIVG